MSNETRGADKTQFKAGKLQDDLSKILQQTITIKESLDNLHQRNKDSNEVMKTPETATSGRDFFESANKTIDEIKTTLGDCIQTLKEVI